MIDGEKRQTVDTRERNRKVIKKSNKEIYKNSLLCYDKGMGCP